MRKVDDMTKHKRLSNSVPVWSDVPTYEDWITALGMDDSDENYGAWLEAFGDEDAD